jgi:galactokinase
LATFSASAPGRVCLLGEHCDWAGGASLTVPLPMKVKVRFRPDGGPELRARSGARRSSWSLPIAPRVPRNPQDPLRYIAAVSMSVGAVGHPCPGGEVEVISDLVEGRGLSSSAALCVATAQAMLASQGAELTPRRLAQVAYEAERERIGIQCGLLDQLACAHARPLLIEWRGRSPKVHGVHIGDTLHLVVGAFPEPRDTAAILARLNELHRGKGRASDRAAVQRALETWGQGAHAGAHALAAGKLQTLGRWMNRAQKTYEEELGERIRELRAPRLAAACATLRDADALGAKFSGAGGDGSVVALAEDEAHAAALAALLRASGLEAWSLPPMEPPGSP